MKLSLNRGLLVASILAALMVGALSLFSVLSIRSVLAALDQLSHEFSQAQAFYEFSSQIDLAGNQAALYVATSEIKRLNDAHTALDAADAAQAAIKAGLQTMNPLPGELTEARSLVERQDRLLTNVRLHVADARRFGAQSGIIDSDRLLQRSLTYQEQASQLRSEVQTYLAADLQAARQQVINAVSLAALAIFTTLIIVLGLILTANVVLRRTVIAPVVSLAKAAGQVAQGELEARPAGHFRGELADLEQAFVLMTTQLSNLVGELEARVTERTRALESRTRYLETSTEVGRAAASILNPSELLAQAADLIAESFRLYYVGIFLVDADRQWAVLEAGSGKAGKSMLARRHRLPLGQLSSDTHPLIGGGTPTSAATSMIAWCILNSQPRIAQEASADYVRQPAPELPETRSEVALPLRSRGQIIGAISAQSAQSNAFDTDILSVLQSMADQLAIAIDNARLYAQSQSALDAERRAYALRSQTDWQDFLKLRSQYFYRGDPAGVTRLDSAAGPANAGPGAGQTLALRPEMQQAMLEAQQVAAGDRLAIPIKIRGSVIGVLDVQARPRPALARLPGDGAGAEAWSDDELAFLQAVTDQLGIALDSARLYAETQHKAAQERLVSEVTGRMRQSLDVEAVLQTALAEISRALDLDDLSIELVAEGNDNNGRPA